MSANKSILTELSLVWVTNSEEPLNKYILTLLDGEGPTDLLVTPYTITLKHPFQREVITVLSRYIIPQGSFIQYNYRVRSSDKVLRALKRYTQQVMYLPLTLHYKETELSTIPENNMVHVLKILRTWIQSYLFSMKYKYLSINVNKVVYERFSDGIITFYPIQDIVLPSSYDSVNDVHRLLPMGIGTVARKLKYPKVSKGTQKVSILHLSETQLKDVQSAIRIKPIIHKTLLSDLKLAKHILPEWADAHDYDFSTIKSLITFVGKEQEIMLIDAQILINSHENIFLDIHQRAKVKEDEGWFVYTIPFTRTAQDPKQLIHEIAKRYSFYVQEEDSRVYELPNTSHEVMIYVPQKIRDVLGISVKEWLDNTISSIYSDVEMFQPTLTLYGEWNQFDELSLTSVDYSKVYYAALHVWDQLSSKYPYLLELTELIKVLPDFGIVFPLLDSSNVDVLRERITSLTKQQALQAIQVQLCPSYQDCISSRILTQQKYPNTHNYSFEIAGKSVLVSNAPHLILVKDPKDRVPKDIIDKEQVYQKIGLRKPKEKYIFSSLQAFIVVLNRVGDNILVGIQSQKTYNSFDLFSIPSTDLKKDKKRIAEVEKMTKELWQKGTFLNVLGKSVLSETQKEEQPEVVIQPYYIRNIQKRVSSFENLRSFYNQEKA